MAAELSAGARAYLEIKQAILSGQLRQRQRLDIDELASRYRVSATPVRHALAVLTAERLVAAHPARGYRVIFWTESELIALYEWRWRLSRIAAEDLTTPSKPEAGAADEAYDEAIGRVLARLTKGGNIEVHRASAGADDRLRAAYRAEPFVLSNTDKELIALDEAIDSGDAKRAAHRLRLFFRRRLAEVAAIRARAGVSALPRNGD